jgi:hypothetical protein
MVLMPLQAGEATYYLAVADDETVVLRQVHPEALSGPEKGTPERVRPYLLPPHDTEKLRVVEFPVLGWQGQAEHVVDHLPGTEWTLRRSARTASPLSGQQRQ